MFSSQDNEYMRNVDISFISINLGKEHPLALKFLEYSKDLD
jgi:hypothetical protein